jgi:hypothetical protein
LNPSIRSVTGVLPLDDCPSIFLTGILISRRPHPGLLLSNWQSSAGGVSAAYPVPDGKLPKTSAITNNPKVKPNFIFVNLYYSRFGNRAGREKLLALQPLRFALTLKGKSTSPARRLSGEEPFTVVTHLTCPASWFSGDCPPVLELSYHGNFTPHQLFWVNQTQSPLKPNP